MDARKTVELTMEEIREVSMILREKADKLKAEESNGRSEQKLTMINRIIEKITH